MQRTFERNYPSIKEAKAALKAAEVLGLECCNMRVQGAIEWCDDDGLDHLHGIGVEILSLGRARMKVRADGEEYYLKLRGGAIYLTFKT